MEDSPVRTSAKLESELASVELEADSGESLPEPFAHFDQSTWSWRTSKDSSTEDSMKFSGTWPRAGMMRNGQCFERATSVSRTEDPGYSLWPTPVVSDSRSSARGTTKTGVMHSGQAMLDVVRRFHQVRKTPKPFGKPGPHPVALHPVFIERLMGFPEGWTEFEYSETPSYRSWLKQWEAHCSQKYGG